MKVQAVSPPPQWVPGYEPKPFSVTGPTLLFDWDSIGKLSTALRFVVRVDTGTATVTPEASYRTGWPAEVGRFAPAPFTVEAGQCYGDPYGIDEMRPWWRLWIAGTATGEWGVQRIPR